MAIGRGTIRLRDRAGVSFLFEPGAPCLELMYTGGEGARSVFETLHVPADLDAWLPGFAGAPVNPVTGAGLAAAKRLREAVWSCTDALAAGAPLPAAAVAQINRHAARPDLVPVLAAAGDRGWAPPVTLDRVLAAVARDAVALLGGPAAATRLRQCAAGDCPLVFVDTSRPGRRRWCAMGRCGNRAKVHAFRHRQREEGSP